MTTQKYLKPFLQTVRTKFWAAVLNFAFIVAFINVFQAIFGQENSIVGVIFAIMMSASMVRDLTATPIKHLLIQAATFAGMGIAACLVSNLHPLAALPINFVMVFIILYAYTYEYSSHQYFPYILSYLFLVFISPIPPEHLPRRLAGLLTGSVCIILYQLFKGRYRVHETAQDVLTTMLDEAASSISYLLSGEGAPANTNKIRETLCKLSRTVYDRRKKALCISNASFAMIDTGRGLESLVLLLQELETPLSPAHKALLQKISAQLKSYRAFVQQETGAPAPMDFDGVDTTEKIAQEFCRCMDYIHCHLIHMTDPEKRTQYHKTALSLEVRLKAALDISCVRVVYALRVSLLVAAFTAAVQLLALPHGKWLLFTLASLSLPYADDIRVKTKKRILATVIGGLLSVAAYALLPAPAGRTAIMMLSGFVSYFFKDYTATYACSTIGALGGAVFMDIFGWGNIGGMFLIRLFYIALGAVIVYLTNCLLVPYRRKAATKQLLEKYAATTGLLSRICQEKDTDPQLYYNLVIQAHLQEEKLTQNASAAGWDGMQPLIEKCRHSVRLAHRRHGPDSWEMPNNQTLC